jgi:hypothetical protein
VTTAAQPQREPQGTEPRPQSRPSDPPPQSREVVTPPGQDQGTTARRDGWPDLLSGRQASAAGELPSVRAVATEDEITLDGRLAEAIWRQAPAATEFTQREPNPGEEASEATEVRVVYTKDTLYIGVRVLDSNPSEIVASDMQRDGGGGGGFGGGRTSRLNSDDTVGIVLDTFFDQRNAYFIETNPLGARVDALVTDEGRNTNFDWDGVWDASSRVDDAGWVTEIAIPFSTLRFNPALDTWGMNVRRSIRRKNEEVFWSPIGLEADLFRVSRAGQLTNIVTSEPGLNLRIKPYGSGQVTQGVTSDVGTYAGDGKGGIDLLRWGVTDSLTLDLTANTDFAQVEADEQRVNLTRFALFFPEKREFFLENAGIFEFGPTSGGGFRPPLLKVFHSRRIGIAEGSEIPLLVGARVTGRIAGKWNIGVLNSQTGEDTVLDEDDELVFVPSTNWTVARVKRNIGERSSVGAIFTNRQGGNDDYNRVVGVDVDIRPRQELSFGGYWTMSEDPGADSDNWAMGANVGWRGPRWRWSVGYTDIRENYNPEVGFLLREGIRRYDPQITWEPRPNIPGIRNMSFQARTNFYTLTDGTLETYDMSLRLLGFTTNSQEFVSFTINPNFERLFEPFEIQDGIEIPPGDYDFHHWSIFFRTNNGRVVSGDGWVQWGEFYDGTKTSIRGGITIRPSPYFSAETEWNHNDIDLPAGAFTTNVFQQRIRVSFSPNVSLNTFWQFNDDAELMSLNTRFDWIYRPGADLFIVYNQTWDSPAFTRPVTADQALIVKFTYLFWF